MPEGTVPDLTDKGTQRLNAPSLQKREDKFISLEYPDFEFEISLLSDVSPDDLIALFILYYTLEIIDSIV